MGTAHLATRRVTGIRNGMVVAFGFVSLFFGPMATAFAVSLSGSPALTSEKINPAASEDPYTTALRYEHGEGVKQDYAHALESYCAAARNGDHRAFYRIGWIYFVGRGVTHNNGIAAFWLGKAAGSGIAEAANILDLIKHATAAAADSCPTPPAPEPVAAPKPLPVAPAAIQALVREASARYGLSAALVFAVIAAESGFDPNAESDRHAKGLMQLLPETAARFGVKDIFDPAENIRGGATYLRWLLKRFAGNLNLALAAYNAGEGSVDNYGGVPPFIETINYLERIRRYYPYKTADAR